MFPFIWTILADQNRAKPVSEWHVHHGNPAIIHAHDACAGGPLRLVALVAIAETQLLVDAVRTCTAVYGLKQADSEVTMQPFERDLRGYTTRRHGVPDQNDSEKA